MPEVAEVGSERISGLHAIECEQHSLRLGQREQVIGVALDLEYRNAIVNRGIPEPFLPVDRTIAGDTVADLQPHRIDITRLRRVQPRVPGNEVVRIIRVRTIRVPSNPGRVESVDEAQLIPPNPLIDSFSRPFGMSE